ncbi:metallopeptidase TldD-related protein [Jatrophihabitans telluris]|uniref:Metallopeptidase TldD-related protein n=1 Tax=Jatrophihabitans telluris TaxID=2038343 RepID=A0ABY4QXV7_9ACTN|nr:metallopeptidase TldD-related protein [Jatrophihabitans telluris]UQX88360.1 metallopeptidase TldD-related protein [Jatrophihabitans telluris]
MVRIQELIEQALSLSTTDGCIVVGAEQTQANLRWADNSLTTNGSMSSRTITVISTVAVDGGTAAGVVSRAVSGPDELSELVAASEAAARASGPADDAAELVPAYDSTDDWNAAAAATSIEVFAEFAPALGKAFAEAQTSGVRLFGFAEHIVTAYFVASSTGLRRRFDQPTGRLELNAKSADLSRSSWGGVQTKDFVGLDVAGLVAGLRTQLGWAENRIDLPAGRYETILPPSAIGDLMIYAYWTGSARDAEEGRNVFSAADGGTKIGERLSSLPLRLHSDPHRAGLECPDFEIARSSGGGMQSVFDNGAAVMPTDWISDGVLTNLARTRSWAARTGTEPVVLIDNLILDGGGEATLEEMIASTERGLLLTCLWYIREVDPQTLLLTGLTRDGVYLIEHGKVVGAVNNFRFNESPIDLLGRISEVGATVTTLPREWNDYFSRTAMPPVRVPDFNMSTVSQAS